MQEKEKVLSIKNHFLDSNIHEEASHRQSTPAISPHPAKSVPGHAVSAPVVQPQVTPSRTTPTASQTGTPQPKQPSTPNAATPIQSVTPQSKQPVQSTPAKVPATQATTPQGKPAAQATPTQGKPAAQATTPQGKPAGKAPAAKQDDDEEIDYNPVENMFSNDVLEWALAKVESEIAEYKSKRKEVPDELETRKTNIEIKIQILSIQVQTEQLTEEAYVELVQQKIAEEKELTKKYSSAGNKEAALLALTRAKIMTKELEGGE